MTEERGFYIYAHGETAWALDDRFKLSALYSSKVIEIPKGLSGHRGGWGEVGLLEMWRKDVRNTIHNENYLPVTLTKL